MQNHHSCYQVILTDGELICRVHILNEGLDKLEMTLKKLFLTGATSHEIRAVLNKFSDLHIEKKSLVSQLRELGLSGYDTR